MKATKLFLSVCIAVCVFSCGDPKESKEKESSAGPQPEATKVLVAKINGTVDNKWNLNEGGRHLVSLSYGINMAFLDGTDNNTAIHWCGSNDKGASWKFQSPALAASLQGVDRYPSLDANASGSYIAFVKDNGGKSVGYVAHLPKPFEDPSRFVVSGPLTSVNGKSQYSFISASKAASSVIYGWTDMATGEIKVGLSTDGEKFPEAKTLAIDKGAISGPAVSIENDYMALTYQSTNPAYYPNGFVQDAKNPKSFPVWMESADGGKTWSKPTSLLGNNTQNFPKITATLVKDNKQVTKTQVLAAGGTSSSSGLSSGLVWAAADIKNPLVFMMNSQTGTKTEGLDKAVTVDNSVGIVSFKQSKAGGDWTHVVSNKGILEDHATGDVISMDHKYSALPKTKIRAVTYLEKIQKGGRDVENNIVIIASTNSGQSFDLPFTFREADLGLTSGQGIVFDVSPCLRADSKGDVWVDMEFSKLVNGKIEAGLYHASLPIAINVKTEIAMLSSNSKAKW
jgi:hypothetical protein